MKKREDICISLYKYIDFKLYRLKCLMRNFVTFTLFYCMLSIKFVHLDRTNSPSYQNKLNKINHTTVIIKY